MGQIELIRQRVLKQGRSVRSTAQELGVSRNTVRKYVRGPAEPRRVQTVPRGAPVRAVVEPVIEQILEEWGPRTTPKQRLTGTRIHRELRERGYEVGITVVRDVLRERRRQRQEAFVPLVHRPGDEAQVDFFEVTVDVGGQRRKAWKFVLRLMCSGSDFAWLYDRQDQVAFLDAHVRAFEHFGAVPRRIVYDNLSLAVKKVLFPNRELTARFEALRRHHQFEPCFARPGEGHDKGGVESRGKTIRLQHMTPIPQGDTLEELSQRLLSDLVAQQAKKADALAAERAEMLSLPEAAFDPRKVVPGRLSRRSVVTVERGTYSLPSRWKCLDVVAYVGVTEVEFVCAGERVTRPRAQLGGSEIRYRDFLPELATKPQALRQVAPELLAELGEPYGRLWALLTTAHGEREGARTLAKVLSAVLSEGEEVVRAALEQTLTTQRGATAERPTAQASEVRVPSSLASYEIEAGRAADYDALLAVSA